MDDFIFGTLSTDALRQGRVRELHGSVTHAFRRDPLDPKPDQPLTLYLSAGPDYHTSKAWVYWTTDGTDPLGSNGVAENGFATEMTPNGAEWDLPLWGYIQNFRAALPPLRAGTRLRYRCAALTYCKGELLADKGAYYGLYIDHDPLPEWASQAVVYHILMDRFNPGGGRAWQTPKDMSGFFGGTLKGVIEKLDYLSDLGFNAIWLSPIFPSPSHHGYDATDLFAIEPRYGTLQDFQNLIAQAHKRGMRILLDYVPNHWSSGHDTFQKALNDPASPYRDWYLFEGGSQKYESFFGVAGLPKLNLRNPQARKYMLDSACYWLTQGVDGFRLDYTVGPTPDFWADFRWATRAVKPDCWTFGEVVESAMSLPPFTGLLDGCLDFMLVEALREAFAFNRWDACRLGSFLERHQQYQPQGLMRPSFLDNHDMNRFLWTAGDDQKRLRLAAMLQFTLPQPPIVYYGTETGLSQKADCMHGARVIPEESRQPLRWENANPALQVYYQKLIGLRHAQTCLQTGAWALEWADKKALLYSMTGEKETLYVAVNLSSDDVKLSLPKAGKVLLRSESDASLSGMELSLPPLGGVVVG